MIDKDLFKYAKDNWGDYKKSMAECSKSGQNRSPLVDCTKEVYCFDDICKDMFENNKEPASVDAVDIFDGEIRFIEFKSGFQERISRENYKLSEKSKCDYRNGEICEEYWENFFKLRDKEKEELVSNIKLKALDTYLAFDKRIFPGCDDLEYGKAKLRFMVVVDADPVDKIEDILGELADKKTSKKNWISSIRQALSRFRLRKDAAGKDYLYDYVSVFSVQEFKNL